MKERISFICQQLLWPATAGNVIWSLLSILIDPNIRIECRCPDVIALLVLGFYMSFNWTRRVHFGKNGENLYFLLLDLAHIICVCVLAISIYYQSYGLSEASLITIFVIASTTHFAGLAPANPNDSRARYFFGTLNALGAILVFLWDFLPPPVSPSWEIAAPLLTIVPAWLFLVRYFARKSQSAPR